MATIRVIERHEDLNSIGCEFFTKTRESHITRVSSTKLRWLSIRKSKGEYVSPMQERACSFLENIADNYGSEDWDKVNLRILLYENPILSQDKYIKILLKCGADLRYLFSKECTKIVIQENVVYLTFASSFEKVVNSGIYYIGKKTSDPYVDYCTKQFDSKFDRAKKLILKNDRIVYADDFQTRLRKEFKNFAMKDWISLILGAIIGGIITVILSFVL